MHKYFSLRQSFPVFCGMNNAHYLISERGGIEIIDVDQVGPPVFMTVLVLEQRPNRRIREERCELHREQDNEHHRGS